MGPELEGLLRAAGEFFLQKLVDAITGGKVEATKDLATVLPTDVAIKLEGLALIAAQRKAAGVETARVDIEEHVRAALAKVTSERAAAGKAGSVGWSDATQGHVARRFVRCAIADLASAMRAVGSLEAEQKAKGL